jgi:hypothetical protein
LRKNPTGRRLTYLGINVKDLGETIETIERAGSKSFHTIKKKETGEVVTQYWKTTTLGFNARPDKMIEKNNSPYFIKLYRTNWLDIVKKKNLTPTEAGIFSLCLAFVGWETNYLVDPETFEPLNESDIAKLTGFDRSTIHSAMESLNSKGLVAIVKKGKGRPNNFQINSNIAFWGSKIKDISEHNVFCRDCAYEPKIIVKYKEITKKE